MKAISEKLLTCSAVLYISEGYDEDRNLIPESSITLENIYISTTRGQSTGTYGAESSDTMSLYYDPIKSKASGSFSWKLGQKLIFDGLTYYVTSITPCYADGLHHYEIGLK